jgi:3-oxoacyl-[acyl-carrier-protein] synthase II
MPSRPSLETKRQRSPLAQLLHDSPLVVTGIGCVSAAGHSAEALWTSAVAGRPTAAWQQHGTERFAGCHAGGLPLGEPQARRIRRSDRAVQLAWFAARQACEQACLDLKSAWPRIGVMTGCSRGPVGRLYESFERLQGGKLTPSLAVDTSIACLSGTLGQEFGLLGPSATISAACASAAVAIGCAAEQILLGSADAMLVGGTEAPLHPVIIAQLTAAGLLASHDEPRHACRPFDVARNGMVPGEGAAFLVLEPARAADRRGVIPLAELRGWAAWLARSGRAGMQPSGAGLLAVMSGAMELGEVKANQVDYINAHATGTGQGDQSEATAVAGLFGRNVPCTSTKPVTGHCMGATAALEAVIAIQALRHQIIPPTANCTQPDPSCLIDSQPLAARPARLRTVLSNSAGFWGHHAALLFSGPLR